MNFHGAGTISKANVSSFLSQINLASATTDQQESFLMELPESMIDFISIDDVEDLDASVVKKWALDLLDSRSIRNPRVISYSPGQTMQKNSRSMAIISKVNTYMCCNLAFIGQN